MFQQIEAGPTRRLVWWPGRVGLLCVLVCAIWTGAARGRSNAGPVPAAAPRPAAVLLQPSDLAGPVVRAASPRSWVAALPSTLRAHIAVAERVFAGAGRPQLFVISRAVVASNARAASRLARAIESAASKEKRLDAATLHVPPGIVRGALVRTWVVGRVVGELVYCDPTGGWGRVIANHLVRAVRARMAAFHAPTAWDRLIARANRERGTVDVHTALQAFTLAIGPLPGVRPPLGPVGAVDPQTAIDWVTADYASLSPRDRAAVTRALNFLARLGRASPRARPAAAALAPFSAVEGG